MVWEPRPQRGHGLDPKNPFQGRWRGWYSAIADWQLANPGGTYAECAKAISRSPAAVGFICATDMYKDYFARRREEWSRLHDISIITKTTNVAEKALDLMLEKMEKQGDKLPMNLVTEVATSALDRLGYNPKAQNASVQVNVDASQQKVVMVPISAEALEEARGTIRAVERQKTMVELEAESESEDEATVCAAVEPTHRS